MASAAPTSEHRQRLPTHHSFTNNGPVEGRAGTRAVVNPATGTPFVQVSLLDEAQARGAVYAAASGFPAWAALSFAERGAHLMRLRAAVLADADNIARLIAREQGKPIAEAHAAEIFPVLESLKHAARHAEELLREEPVGSQVAVIAHKEAAVTYTPYGVVLVITPWNYPFAIPMTSIAQALICGNTVVLKPAPATTLVGLRIGELCAKAGLPDGVVNVCAVDDGVAAALVEDPRVSKVVFTGGTATGRKVMAAAAKNLTPVVLELGGKDAAVVCKDADLDRAAAGLVWGGFLNAGQTCASVERVYVEAAVADRFIEKVVYETAKLRLGDPTALDVDVGPLTLERQRAVVEEHVADAKARGARVLVGGERTSETGNFYPPTVLTDVDHSMRIMKEETFGPVLPIMRVDSLDEAIALANDSPYGLTASGWTRSEETAKRLQRDLRAGVVLINDCLYSYGEPSAPWGGCRQSGMGRTHGLAGLREMVQVKYVARDTRRGRVLWWYPYGADFAAVMSAANRALHDTSPWRRLVNGFRLLRSRRFWHRARPLALLRHLNKMV